MSLPVKARLSLVSKVLTERWGYHIDLMGNRPDRAIIKALTLFQKDKGIGPNGIICEKTFEALGLKLYENIY